MMPGWTADWALLQLPVNWKACGCIRYKSEDPRPLEAKDSLRVTSKVGPESDVWIPCGVLSLLD